MKTIKYYGAAIDVPDDARFIALTGIGVLKTFEHLPQIVGDLWYNKFDGYGVSAHRRGAACSITDWKNSLRAIPSGILR